MGRGYHLIKEIEALKAEKEKAYIEATRTVQSTDVERVQSSAGHGDDKMAAYAEYSRKLEDAIYRRFEVKCEIIDLIDSVPSAVYRDILFRRYISCEKWETIALGMNYSTMQIWRLHGKALLCVQRILKDEKML
jgi:hypothetical protein